MGEIIKMSDVKDQQDVAEMIAAFEHEVDHYMKILMALADLSLSEGKGYMFKAALEIAAEILTDELESMETEQ